MVNQQQTAPASNAAGGDDNTRLDALMNRIHQLTMAQSPSKVRPTADVAPAAASAPAPAAAPSKGSTSGEWMPIEPDTLALAGLTDGENRSARSQNTQWPRGRDRPLPV
jgi:hypothetical protein